jgi:hypothetical protein
VAKSIVFEKPRGAYVYCILVDGVERYIGKGRGSRAVQHLWNSASIIRRRDRGEKVRASKFQNFLIAAIGLGGIASISIIIDGLSDEEAYAKEIEEIALRGRDILWNQMPGGRGFTSKKARELWTEEHRLAMSAHSLKHWEDAGRRQRQSEWAKRINETRWAEGSEGRRVQSEKAKARTRTSEGRAMQSRKAKSMWTEEFRLKRSAEVAEQSRQRWANPDERDRAKATVKARWADGDLREVQPAAMKRKWADPEWRSAQIAAFRDPEVRRRNSEAVKARWADPAYRERVLSARAKHFAAKDS